MNLKELTKVASAPSEILLARLINRFYYSENYTIENNQAYNPKTGKRIGVVVEKKGRFTYYI